MLFKRPITRPNTTTQHNNCPPNCPCRRHKTNTTLRPNSASTRRPEYKLWKQAWLQSIARPKRTCKFLFKAGAGDQRAVDPGRGSIQRLFPQFSRPNCSATHCKLPLQAEHLKNELAKTQQEAEANRSKSALVEQTLALGYPLTIYNSRRKRGRNTPPTSQFRRKKPSRIRMEKRVRHWKRLITSPTTCLLYPLTVLTSYYGA